MREVKYNKVLELLQDFSVYVMDLISGLRYIFYIGLKLFNYTLNHSPLK